MKRLTFLKSLAGLGFLLNANLLQSCKETDKSLKVLILGGTNFVGPPIVKAALEKGHNVTLFNRGITNPHLFPDLKRIKGDREIGEKSYKPLLGEKWDVVIDVWPEKASLVEEATRKLSNHTKHYIFISSIAVYNDFQEVGLNESSETIELLPDKEDWTYSEEKLAAEQYVIDRFGENHTILRPGPITGLRDPAMDLAYWCVKLNRDESIIAPGSGNDPIQFIDVKDVGRFLIMTLEYGLKGIYNCVGPKKEELVWRDFLALAQNHFESNTSLIWVDEEFLLENKVRSFSDLPLWAPLSEDRGFMQISNQKLIDTGFVFTPIGETLDDCMDWLETHHEGEIEFATPDIAVGLARPRELALMNLYSKMTKSE